MTNDTIRGGGATEAIELGTGAADAWNLVRASELEGRTVRGQNDETIGTVGDLFIDYDEHAVRYATVDVGGFLGIGAKTVLVPFERLQWSGEDLFLPVEREILEQAPEFDPTSTYDRSYEENLTGVWGTDPYWRDEAYGSRHSHWRGERHRGIL